METTDTWAAFGSEYLKAIEVASDTDEYAIVGVESREEEGKGTVLILKLQRGDLNKIFGCNKTNLYSVQEECPINAKQAIGRIVTFNKVRVERPGSVPKKMVDGLRLVFKPAVVTEPSEVDTKNAGLDENNEM